MDVTLKSETVAKKLDFDLSESKKENGEKDDENNEQREPKSHNLFLGCILAFLSGVFYNIQNAIPAKEQINLSEALIFRNTFIGIGKPCSCQFYQVIRHQCGLFDTGHLFS